MAKDDKRVYLYDSTLRDGAQARGVDFSALDKQAISHELDKLGIDFIEGGWPGANPTDDVFFADLPKLKHAKVYAFGMTRKGGRSADNDPQLSALLDVPVEHVCIVGKCWDFQVKTALNVSAAENQRMIESSVERLAEAGREVAFDAEHFFDGYKANAEFALNVLRAAYEAGATWLVLCDTNGGSMPDEVERITAEVKTALPEAKLGIHCHNDTGNAVANSLAAVRAGARQVQGTINGVGERCGNANLITIIPNLVLKMGFKTGVSEKNLSRLTAVSRMLDERLNRAADAHAPYVGDAAFAHKGGLHVAAIAKDARTYEHIDPAQVGNKRAVLVSDKAGRSNMVTRLRELGLDDIADSDKIPELLREVKERERKGYAYDGADASFALLARRRLGEMPRLFEVESFRVLVERRHNARGKLVSMSEATMKLVVGDRQIMTVAEGNGPVNALDKALRKALVQDFPKLKSLSLSDYKVRIITPQDGTEAVTRVLIESRDDKGHIWNTVGVSANVMDASFSALMDAVNWMLLKY